MMKRTEHNHIFQAKDHVEHPTCEACRKINPRRMTLAYVFKAYHRV